MVLLWVVPVLALGVGVALVVAHLRALEDQTVDLLVAFHRIGEARTPLAELRQELDRSAPLVDQVWTHWSDAAADTGDEPAK